MELDDHQMPLFDWHPLEEEFARRLRSVSAWIERCWPRYNRSPEELARQVYAEIEIHPLELLLDKLIVEEVAFGSFCETPSYRYDYYIPFLGDDMLWSLSPRGLPKFPEGETFRRRLILVVKCEREMAEQEARLALSRIGDVLGSQAREIEDFHSKLAARIQELVCVVRRDGLHSLPL